MAIFEIRKKIAAAVFLTGQPTRMMPQLAGREPGGVVERQNAGNAVGFDVETGSSGHMGRNR